MPRPPPASLRSGVRVGFLELVSRRAGFADRRSAWLVRCDCGVTKYVAEVPLARGRTKSCGCRAAWFGRTNNLRHGHAGRGALTAEYAAWMAMRSRCTNPKNNSFRDYGARGIRVCERWSKSFESFLADVGRRPSPGHSIDRIDNSRGYEPGNVRWATRYQQNSNRRSNRVLTVRGRSMTLAQWAAELGVERRTLTTRLRLGWSVERVLTEPVNLAKRNGRARCVA